MSKSHRGLIYWFGNTMEVTLNWWIDMLKINSPFEIWFQYLMMWLHVHLLLLSVSFFCVIFFKEVFQSKNHKHPHKLWASTALEIIDQNSFFLKKNKKSSLTWWHIGCIIIQNFQVASRFLSSPSPSLFFSINIDTYICILVY